MADFRFYPDPPSWSDITRRALEGDTEDLLALIPEREHALEDYLKLLAASISGGGGGGTDIFLVAGVNAPTAVKNAANAVCDGTADQTELNSSPGGVVVAVGDFNITGTVTVSALIGYAPGFSSGNARTTITVSAGTYSSANAIVATTLSGVEVKTSSNTVGHLARATSVHSCTFTGPSNGAVVGLAPTEVLMVTASKFSGLVQGVASGGSLGRAMVYGSEFSSCATAVEGAAAVVACRAAHDTAVAWQSASLIEDCRVVSGCVLRDSGLNYPVIYSSVSSWSSNTTVANNAVRGGSVGIKVGGGGSFNPYGPVVTGNTVSEFADTGITCGARSTVTGNTVAAVRPIDSVPAGTVGIKVSGTTTNNMNGGLVSSNRVAEVDIGIDVDGDEHAVIGNLVRETATAAIRIKALSDDTFVTGNDCLGGVITDLGTGTVLSNNRV